MLSAIYSFFCCTPNATNEERAPLRTAQLSTGRTETKTLYTIDEFKLCKSILIDVFFSYHPNEEKVRMIRNIMWIIGASKEPQSLTNKLCAYITEVNQTNYQDLSFLFEWNTNIGSLNGFIAHRKSDPRSQDFSMTTLLPKELDLFKLAIDNAHTSDYPAEYHFNMPPLLKKLIAISNSPKLFVQQCTEYLLTKRFILEDFKFIPELNNDESKLSLLIKEFTDDPKNKNYDIYQFKDDLRDLGERYSYRLRYA